MCEVIQEIREWLRGSGKFGLHRPQIWRSDLELDEGLVGVLYQLGAKRVEVALDESDDPRSYALLVTLPKDADQRLAVMVTLAMVKADDVETERRGSTDIVRVAWGE